MRIFQCIDDVSFMGKVLLKKGERIIPTDDVYIIGDPDKTTPLRMTLEEVLNHPVFKEINAIIDISSKEILQSEEDIIKNWTLQLTVKTSRKKLREIEDFLREQISRIIEE